MSTTTCDNCTAATSNGLALCKTCQTTAKVGVENIAVYHRDLLSLGGQRVVTRKASGHSDPTGTTAAAIGAPERDAGDVAAAETKAQLVGWILALIDDRPQVIRPRDTVADMAAVLAKRTSTIATLSWAGAYVHDVLVLERRLHKIVERGKGRWYAGICSAELAPERLHDATSCTCSCHLGAGDCDIEGGSCGPEAATIPGEYCDRDLYAVPGSSSVRCPVCRNSHSVIARRAILLEEANETMLPLPTIAQVCVALLDGEPSVERLYNRIRKWVDRGDLDDYGVRVLTGKPQRVYRLGDVLDTLIGDAARASRRTP